MITLGTECIDIKNIQRAQVVHYAILIASNTSEHVLEPPEFCANCAVIVDVVSKTTLIAVWIQRQQ